MILDKRLVLDQEIRILLHHTMRIGRCLSYTHNGTAGHRVVLLPWDSCLLEAVNTIAAQPPCLDLVLVTDGHSRDVTLSMRD